MQANAVSSPVRGLLAGRRVVAVLAGATVVALSAQVAIPLPGTPVPVTLQGLAVLLVGGLLGAGPGAAALVLYLAAGIAGLPVFAPVGVPAMGLARLLGSDRRLPAGLPGGGGGHRRRLPPGHGLARCIVWPPSSGWRSSTLGGLAQLAILSGAGSGGNLRDWCRSSRWTW